MRYLLDSNSLSDLYKPHNIDIMLAATAVTEDCTLIRVPTLLQKIDPMLRVENWLT